LAYAGAGRTVATFEPTYQLHGHIARLTGARTLEGERAEDFSLDLAEVTRLLTAEQPDVTFLCSPNNPTGMVDSPDAVRAVAALQPGLLVVDEAYGQFAPWSAITLVDEDEPVVVTRTFSKTWSMAAARLGYCIGPSWLVAELDKVVLPYHLDAAKQLAGVLALDYVAEMESRVKAVIDERSRLMDRLASMPVRLWPSGANFILFRPRERSGGEVWQGLLDRSVLVRNCASWPRLENCLRVTVGTPKENDAFIGALMEVLS
jgi:histidinol-phosphate aminotransferase